MPTLVPDKAWFPTAAHINPAGIPDSLLDPNPLSDNLRLMPTAWGTSELPGFQSETVYRTVRVTGRYITPLGQLYPGAQIMVGQAPCRPDTFLKLSGANLARLRQLIATDHVQLD